MWFWQYYLRIICYFGNHSHKIYVIPTVIFIANLCHYYINLEIAENYDILRIAEFGKRNAELRDIFGDAIYNAIVRRREMIDFIAVGNNIASKRRELNLTQEELANKLFVTRQLVSKWENGTGVPSIDDLLNMSEIFGITIEDLLCLNKTATVDPDDIFAGHERLFVVKSIIEGKMKIDIPENFYRFSQAERIMILKAIKSRALETDMESLKPRLTPAEQKFLKTEV